jgi:hypothetical protein
MARPSAKKELPSEKEFEFKDRIYLLKGSATPITHMLRSKHSQSKPLLYFDQDTRSNKALRWSDNQSSPFIDEQDGYAVSTPIIFENGVLRVKKEQVELQKFLSIYHPDNGSVYHEFDAEEKAAEEYDELTSKLEAQIAAKEMPIEELEAIARVLLKGKVDKMTSSELRRDMLIYAGRNPKEFTSLMNDDSVKFRNIAIRAVQLDIIRISTDGRTVNWGGKDGGRIITIPFGENAYSALASFFLTDEGMDVLSDISNKL